MNKKAMILLSVIFVLILPNLASAVIFDIAAARQEEWERYKEYREDYIQTNDLEAFSKYVSNCNLQSEFGFKPASYYYIPPSVLAAKYNPPLQGVAYSTGNRGYTSSLNQPSAVKYYGEEVNGRITGNIPSNLNGKYFDHPQIYGSQNYLINNYNNNYPSYSNYNSYDYSYNNNYGYNFGYNQPAYSGAGFLGDIYGVYGNSGYGDHYSNYGYSYGNYQYLAAYDANTGEPAHYARIVEPITGGFYIVGYY